MLEAMVLGGLAGYATGKLFPPLPHEHTWGPWFPVEIAEPYVDTDGRWTHRLVAGWTCGCTVHNCRARHYQKAEEN